MAKPIAILNSILSSINSKLISASKLTPEKRIPELRAIIVYYNEQMVLFNASVHNETQSQAAKEKYYIYKDGLRVFANQTLLNKYHEVIELEQMVKRQLKALESPEEDLALEDLAVEKGLGEPEPESMTGTPPPALGASHPDRAPDTLSAKVSKASEVLEKISAILSNLDSKIQEVSVGEHHAEARTTAETLWNTLFQARLDLEDHLENKKQKDNTPISSLQAVELFKNTCKTAIQTAIPVLERDLGWGDFLLNLLKKLYNAIASIFTDNPDRLFQPAKAKVQSDFEQALQEIESQTMGDKKPGA